MNIDRAKVLKGAQKLLAKGQLRRAVAEYSKVVQHDPKDVRTWLKIGDLYTKLDEVDNAIKTYERVADQYALQGFFLKSVAVYKQILRLQPDRLEAWERLAEMYGKLSLASDALVAYEQLAQAHSERGDTARALEAIENMVEVDPSNIAARVKYAEALSRAGRPDEAARSFEQAANMLKEQGRLDDYLKVAERLLYHRPEDAMLAEDIARQYLQRGDAKHALGKLQICFKTNPLHVPTLELLGQAFSMLGQIPKTVSVYKEIARIHAEAGRPEARANALRKVLELDPSDQEARHALDSVPPVLSQPGALVPASAVSQVSTAGQDSAAAIVVPDDADEGDETSDLIIIDEANEAATGLGEVQQAPVATEPTQPAGHESAPPPLSARPPQPQTAADPEARRSASRPTLMRGTSLRPGASRQAQVERMISECEVFERYGLHDKTIEQLMRVLELDPEHAAARVKLKDAYVASGASTQAVSQLLALAERRQVDDPAAAAAHLREAVDIEPENETARARLASLEQAGLGQPAAERDTAPDAARDEVDIDIVVPDDEEPITEQHEAVTEPRREAFVHEAPTRKRAAQPEASPVGEERDTGRHVQPWAQAEARPAERDASREAEAADLPEDVSDAIEEADFYLQQGLTDEARECLQDALESYPDHPALLGRLANLSEAEDAGSAPEPQPAAPSDQSFALAEKLAEELTPASAPEADGSGALDLSHVLQQFKAGVAEQIDRHDSATHYDLGIAYMEMGLHDDAIGEFTLCLDDPNVQCTAHTMIGLSHVSKGDMAEGIKHFHRALETPACTDDERLGLWFEIGNAHELLSQNDEALEYFYKVAEQDETFRDVTGRLERLQSSSVPDENEELDALFDNLVRED